MKIIITGASDGIGKAMALAFARRGHELGLIARREALLEQVAGACRAAGAPRVEIAAADVTGSTLYRAALDDLVRRLGGIDGFVINAGINAILDATIDEFTKIRRILDVNLLGAIDGIEHLKARLIERRGWIAGVTSVAAARGLPGSGPYCASKAGFHAYLEALQIDLKSRGVTVSIIAPGFIDTPMTQENNDFPMPFLMDAAAAGEIFARQTLRGRPLIIAPRPFIIAYWALRALPVFLYGLIAKRVGFQR